MRERVREAAATTILEAVEHVAAERAGVAVGTLYNYFPDRDALIVGLFKLRREEMLPRIIAAADAARGLPFEQRVRAYLTGVAEVFDQFRPFCRVAMSAEGIRVKRSTPAVLTVCTDALIEIVKPVAKERAKEVAVMVFGALKAMMHARIESNEPLAPAAQLLADTLLEGMLKR